MGGIDVGRWIGSGIAAGMFVWVVEGAASLLYMDEMVAALEAHGLAMEMSPSVLALTIVVSLLLGLVLMFFYAAARPRFGAGPGTAVRVAVALWAGGTLIALIGHGMVGLYPGGMLAIWAVVGLVETVLAAMIGGWIYREG
jgi:hypothetical protein